MAGAAPATSSSRYDTILKLASGGMATVWVGTVRGALGFRQLVAIKKPHPHLIGDPSFRNEIVTEARLASMIHHANVVDVRDVEIDGDSISLVMDYIEGASLGELIVASAKAGKLLPPRVAVRIAVDALAGLHAAHELVDERGRPVGLVHRDVSPQNILVGTDGIARVADFGVAKFARKNMASTSDGSLKGKLAYMAPEYTRGEAIDRRFDVFALGVVLWEALSGKRCFRGENEANTLDRVRSHEPPAISTMVPELGTALDEILACALAKSRDERFLNAAAMAAALEATAGEAHLIAGHVEVAATVKELAGAAIEERRALVRAKLASEPSVASLLGVPAMGKAVDVAIRKAAEVRTAPLAEPMSVAPQTEVDAPRTEVEMPRTEVDPAPSTVLASSVVPSTLPMTPRMEGAPPPPVMKTLSSGSAPVGTVAPLLAVRGPPAVAPSSPTLEVHADYTDDEPAGVPPQRRWLSPLLVGLATAAVAGALGYGLWRSRAHEPSTGTAVATGLPPSSTSATAGATASSAIPTGSTVGRGANLRPGARPGTHGASPAASATGMGHKPPPTPFENLPP